MGNSKSPKKSGLPKRAFPNIYEPTFKSANAKDSPQPDEISFLLVKIDPKVANLATVNDSVKSVSIKNEIEIHTSQGRLGNVPFSRNNTVLKSRLTNGFITEISRNRDRIRVTLIS